MIPLLTVLNLYIFMELSSSIDSSEDAFLLQIFISGFVNHMWVSVQ